LPSASLVSDMDEQLGTSPSLSPIPSNGAAPDGAAGAAVGADEDEPYEDTPNPESGIDTIQQRWEEYDPIDHVAEYIHGILWTLNSYINGMCADYGWFFPYSSGPSYAEYHYFMLSDVALDLMQSKKSSH